MTFRTINGASVHCFTNNLPALKCKLQAHVEKQSLEGSGPCPFASSCSKYCTLLRRHTHSSSPDQPPCRIFTTQMWNAYHMKRCISHETAFPTVLLGKLLWQTKKSERNWGTERWRQYSKCGATLFGASLEVYLFTTAVYSITITLYLPFTGFVGYLKLTQFWGWPYLAILYRPTGSGAPHHIPCWIWICWNVLNLRPLAYIMKWHN